MYNNSTLFKTSSRVNEMFSEMFPFFSVEARLSQIILYFYWQSLEPGIL